MKPKTLDQKKYGNNKDVRNSREFNSLTKEVEFQELEIQLGRKKKY